MGYKLYGEFKAQFASRINGDAISSAGAAPLLQFVASACYESTAFSFLASLAQTTAHRPVSSLARIYPASAMFRRRRNQRETESQQEQQQLVPTAEPNQPVSGPRTKPPNGARLEVQSQHNSSQPPAPQIIVQPGSGHSNQNLTVINKIYYNIVGFPRRGHEEPGSGGEKSIMGFLQSNWLLLLILMLVVLVIFFLVAIMLSGNGKKLQPNNWGEFGRIIGEATGEAYKVIRSVIKWCGLS